MILPACTIISSNYAAYARVLASSYLEHHPDARVFVLLVDRVEGGLELQQEPFELIEIEALPNLPDPKSFLFKYDQLQACTAAKPYFIAYLLERFGLERLVYLDPDLQVLGPFEELAARLDSHTAVLTPHLTAPLDDEAYPDEPAILASGTYNLGFLGVRRSRAAERMLDWWQRRVYDGCHRHPEAGGFVDQRWMDLAPGLFDGVHILTHPGYNVAYWNLHDRAIELSPAGVTANGLPLRCFHFSGLEPESLEIVSRHQDRYRLADLGSAAELFHRYRELLLAARDRDSRRCAYAYGSFDDGTPIDPAARSLYAAMGSRRRRFGDPFCTAQPGSFRSWLESHGRLPLRRRVQELRPSLRSRLARQLEPRLRRIVGPRPTRHLVQAARRVLPPAQRRQLAALRSIPPPARLEPFGVNLVGYLQSESGMGQAARSLAATLATAGLPHTLHTLDLNDPARQQDPTYPVAESSFPYAVNLFCVNADQLPELYEHLGPEVFAGRYNVGYWLWELDTFPALWQRSFAPLNEVWTPSSFSLQAICAASPIPVRRLPLAVAFETPARPSREPFGLPRGSCLFLFVFSFLGHAERKNAVGVIRAFRRAFEPSDDARLLIKSCHSELAPEERDRLSAAVGEEVHWIDSYFTRQQTYDLIATCDAYVSLHRSEGFGLTVAEAMGLGRPVIATPYGGVSDFFDLNVGLPVRYRMARIEHAVGPYPEGALWADPDVADAAAQMRGLYEQRERASRLGLRGKEQVERLLSREAVAGVLRRHLESILRRAGTPRPLRLHSSSR